MSLQTEQKSDQQTKQSEPWLTSDVSPLSSQLVSNLDWFWQVQKVLRGETGPTAITNIQQHCSGLGCCLLNHCPP